ncbi:hypothetical protein [Sagittula sp. NFXS13]|uniref:hypothetical protein n=1 Tax=Sagittula sp. NFXS13 TaxID=2819095 RepID=UPI0032DE2C3B
MEPCQGRYRGLTVTTLLAEAHGQTPEHTGDYRIRSPLTPVTLGCTCGERQLLRVAPQQKAAADLV